MNQFILNGVKIPPTKRCRYVDVGLFAFVCVTKLPFIHVQLAAMDFHT